jgi:phosphodiesterase/alkaline phosphatase D-like protein
MGGVSSSGLIGTGATITWTTNEPADTQVEYGTTTGYGSSTTLNTAMVTSHSQALSGLTAGTLYHYRVKSRDAAGNLATSGDYTFTTTSAPDATSPVISDVESSGITSSGATITWTTDEESDTQVEYGTSASYGSTTDLNTAMVTSHSQSLGGLTAGTPYHYRVKSRDAAGNLATSGDYTFTTTEDLNLTFALPRFAAGSSAEETFMGIALANLDSAPAEVTFTAVATNGNLVGGPRL